MFGQYPFQKSTPTNSSSRPRMVPTTGDISSANQTSGPKAFPLESRSGLLNNGREISMNIYRNKPSNVPFSQSNVQRSISEYFKDLKAQPTPRPSEPVSSTSKRLREKYDNFCSQPVSIPEKIQFPRFVSKRENEQRVEYAKQMTATTECGKPPKKRPKELQAKSANNRTNSTARKCESKMIHLIGYVEDALTWHEVLRGIEVHVIFNVVGKFINVIRGAHELKKHVFIRGNNGCILECCYYEAECPLPKVTKGQLVACVGHMLGRQKLSLYSMYTLDQTGNLDIQRSIFLSQRMVLEYSGTKSI